MDDVPQVAGEAVHEQTRHARPRGRRNANSRPDGRQGSPVAAQSARPEARGPSVPSCLMQADWHALTLLMFPIATLAAILSLHRRTPTLGQSAVALLAAAAGALAASPLCLRHMCWEGQARAPWLVLGPCLLLVLLVVRDPRWRRILAAVVLVSMLKLSCQFGSLVHEPGWTGNPDWDGGAALRFDALRQDLAVAVAEDGAAQRPLPAGWLRDLPTGPQVQQLLARRTFQRRDVGRSWHTWLTGLYPYVLAPQDVWFPGGPLDELGERVRLRDRAAP